MGKMREEDPGAVFRRETEDRGDPLAEWVWGGLISAVVFSVLEFLDAGPEDPVGLLRLLALPLAILIVGLLLELVDVLRARRYIPEALPGPRPERHWLP